METDQDLVRPQWASDLRTVSPELTVISQLNLMQ